jgi:pimeloyl-ACP methyl ester carboxylesterase
VIVVLLALFAVHPGTPASTEGLLREVRVRTASRLNPDVVFHYRLPGAKPYAGVLVVVPGFNGDGRDWLRDGGGWAEFAEQEKLVLVAPTFKTNEEEIHARHGYYYPEEWSGKATLETLDRIHRETGVDVRKVLLFGYSAGAHFTHRFANWRPDRVRAFVAYSAGWWDAPSPALRGVPALVMCGEDDPRFGATREFMRKAQALHLPWLWRSYAGTDHEITPAVRRMAEAFLGACQRGGEAKALAGDLQTYEVFPQGGDEAEAIPEELRVALPSRGVAEIWKQEK